MLEPEVMLFIYKKKEVNMIKTGWKVFRKLEEGYAGVHFVNTPYRVNDFNWARSSSQGYIYSPTRKIARQAIKGIRTKYNDNSRALCIRKILYHDNEVLIGNKVVSFLIVRTSKG
jgi:hypothetical protein